MNEEAVHHQGKIKHGHQPSRGKSGPLRCSRFSCTNQLIRARIWWVLRDPGGLGRHGIKSSKQLIGTLFTWKREGSLAMQLNTACFDRSLIPFNDQAKRPAYTFYHLSLPARCTVCSAVPCGGSIAEREKRAKAKWC